MKKIDRKKICEYINSLLNDRCYVGLHSIVDVPTISNGYENLSKSEKAVSIMENGLINRRGSALSHTVRFFGDLAVANAEVKDKMSNYYQGINRSGENYVAVVAIPYFFEGPQGQKMFGGYKSYDSESQFRESSECITDTIFSEKVPSEMILGYYTYDDKERTVSFVENPRYYSKLSKEEQLQFVMKNFGSYVDRFDVNNAENVEKMFNYMKNMRQVNGAFNNTINQYLSLKSASLDHSHNVAKEDNQEEYSINQVNTQHMQLEYPDSTIHDVECYRLAKAQLKDGSYVYFIEYKDKVIGSDEVIDSYAILENINGIFCKSDVRIEYNLLNQNVIREMDLKTLPITVTMKGSKRTEDALNVNYKRNEKQLEKIVGGGGSINKPFKPEKEEVQQLQDIYIVLPMVTGTNESLISFDRLVYDFNYYGKFASFSVAPEKLNVPTHQESSYSNDCKILDSCELDANTVQGIINYLNEQAKGERGVIASRLQELVLGNYRYNFIPSSDNQYELATNQTLKQIYLFSKKGHENVGMREMVQRYMSGTVFGMEKFVNVYGEEYTQTEPQLREKDKEELDLILEENKLLRARENYPSIEGIYPHVTDSYELDDALVLLKKHNAELKKLSPLTQEQLEEQNKRQLQAFSDFFSAIGVNNMSLDENILENQVGTKLGR